MRCCSRRFALFLGTLFVLLSACVAPTPTPIPSTTPPPASNSTEPGLSPQLHIFIWSDYMDEELIAVYEDTYGVDVQIDTYASNAELLARLQEGGDYDVVFPSDYMVEEMVSLNLLAPLDLTQIPNATDILPHLQHPPYDPKGLYSVPYVWGVSGLLYNMSAFGDATPDSWAYLFDPDHLNRYSGRGINVLKDKRQLIGAALKFLGYSVNDTDEKHLFEARDVILKAKPFWKEMNAADYVETLVIPDKVVLSQANSRDAFAAIWQTYDTGRKQPTWAFSVPKEGSTFWADTMAIPASSKRKRTAAHFINFLLDPEHQAANTNYTYFAAPSEKAKQYIKPEIVSNLAIYPPPDVLSKTEWIKDVGEKRGLYNRVWIEVTSW